MYKIIFYTPFENGSDSIPHTLEHLQCRMLENPDLGFGDRWYDGAAKCFQGFTEYLTQGTGSNAASIKQFLTSYCETKTLEQEIRVLEDEYTNIALGSKLVEQLYNSIQKPVHYTTYSPPTIDEIKSYHKKWYTNGSKAIVDSDGKIVYFDASQSPGLGERETLKQYGSFIFENTQFKTVSNSGTSLRQHVTGIIACDYTNTLLAIKSHSAGVYHNHVSRFCYLGDSFGIYTPVYDRFTLDNSMREISHKNIYRGGIFDRSTDIGCISLILGKIITMDEIYEIIDSLTFQDIKAIVD